MQAIHGHVSGVQRIESQGLTRVSVDVPDEWHDEVVDMCHSQDVLVTPSSVSGPYGVLVSESPADESQNYGHYYTSLYRSGWFNALVVAKVVGSDEQYQEYCRSLPSAVSGEFSEYIDGTGRSIYAHVRRAGQSGTAHKPEYSGIPLTHAEHELQHQKGESAIAPPAWWEKQVTKYRTAWIKERIQGALYVSSLAEVPPEAFARWCQSHGIYHTLPSVLRVL